MKFLALLFSLCFVGQLMAKTVLVEEAKLVGESFLSHQLASSLKSSRMISLSELKVKSLYTKAATMDADPFFLFKDKTKGFVIVAGDDRVKPILAYSLENTLEADDLPDAFVELLGMYAEEIAYAKENSVENKASSELWSSLRRDDLVLKSGEMGSAVDPLLTSTWNQRPYYNAMCPQDLKTGKRAVTGCVATAMAQIMNYYEYPRKAEGYLSYIENDFGLQNVLFFNAQYDWNNMPDVLNASSSSAEHLALSKLMYHCGVAVRMNYGLGESGASMNAIVDAFESFFAYDNSVTIRAKGSMSFSDWEQEVKTEIDAGRPLLYAGFGKASGHAFILDGYSDDQFHINWGWGGSSDGYFSLTALNPGSYPSGFNSWQQGIFGLQPRENYSRPNLSLNKALRFLPDTLYHLSSADLVLDVKNNGSNEFDGYLSVVLFDLDTVELSYFGGKYGIHLNANETFGDDTLLHVNNVYAQPGSYLAGLVCRSGGQAIGVADGAYSNFVPVEVVSSLGAGSLMLLDSVLSSERLIFSQDSLSLKVKLKNTDDLAYTGQVRAEVYSAWGNLEAVLDSVDILNLNTGDSLLIEMNIDTLKLSPGSYYLYLFEKASGESSQLQITRGNFQNPRSFIVLPSPPKGDKYEANDSLSEATFIPLIQSGNYLSARIDSASIHVDEDRDFYKMVLPEGPYAYSVWIGISGGEGRGKNEQDGGSSLHMLIHHEGSILGPWENYSQGAILLNAGDTFRLEVFPFFLGLTQGYEVSIHVNQIVITDDKPISHTGLKVYPNPVHDVLNIESEAAISRVDLYALDGKLLLSEQNVAAAARFDIHHLAKGVYLLDVRFKNGKRVSQKLVIAD